MALNPIHNQPFRPALAGTVSVSATTSTASTSIAAGDVQNPCIRVYNAGTVVAFVTWGAGSATASATTCTPIAPGWSEVFYKANADTVAAITATGTATVYFTPGNGF